jgi:taurine dehydrogenase small subunit
MQDSAIVQRAILGRGARVTSGPADRDPDGHLDERKENIPMTDMERSNAAVMQRLGQGFARHDVDAILDGFTDDGIFDITQGPDPCGERFKGKPAIRKALENFFAAIPDVQFTNATEWVSGERGTSEWVCEGTTLKGRPIRVNGCDLFTFRDGLITRKDSDFKRIIRPDAR